MSYLKQQSKDTFIKTGVNRLPRVSVIIPTYNGKHFIRRTIRSIISQSYNNYEIIVIDDGSTDNTRSVIKKISSKKIKYVLLKKNMGISKARNHGLRLARGQYIAYCDHDDEWKKDHLKKMVSVLDRRSDIGLVYAKYHVVGTHKGQRYDSIFPHEGFSKQALETSNIIGCPLNVLHRKECVKKVGYFPENMIFNLYSYEDWDLWLRISDEYGIYHIKSVLSKYHYHSRNRSKSINTIKSQIYIINKRIKKYKSKKLFIEYVFYIIFPLSLQLINNKDLISLWPKLRNKLARLNIKKWRDIILYYCKGIDLFTKGNFSEALDIFKKTIFSFKNSKYNNTNIMMTLNFLMARCEEEMGNVKKAIQLHKKVVNLTGNMLSKERLILLFYKLGKLEKTLKLANIHETSLSYNIQGAIFFKKKHYQKALSLFKKAIALDPDYLPARKNLKMLRDLL